VIAQIKLEEPWLGLFQDGMRQIRQLEDTILRSQATIYRAQQEQAATRKTLGVLVGVLPDALGMPPSFSGYHLSEDGTMLIGDTDEAARGKVVVENVGEDSKE